MKLAFEYLTSSFSLFDNPIKDYVVMTIIGIIAFRVAYSVVGDFYSLGIIDGRESGHVLHWIIRLIVFGVAFYVSATIIRIYNWFHGLPDYKWWIVGVIIGLTNSRRLFDKILFSGKVIYAIKLIDERVRLFYNDE